MNNEEGIEITVCGRAGDLKCDLPECELCGCIVIESWKKRYEEQLEQDLKEVRATKEKRDVAMTILSDVSAYSLSGRAPSTISAAIIYIAGVFEGRRITQKEMRDILTVSLPSIRSNYGRIVKDVGNDYFDRFRDLDD